MHIAYTGDVFRNQSRGGISRYFCEIASRLDNSDTNQVSVNAKIHFNHHLRESKFAGSGIFLPISTQRLGFNRKINDLARWLETKHTNRNEFDLIHLTSLNATQLHQHVPTVLTVFDLIREKEDKSGNRMRLLDSVVRKQDAVITISESTKRELLENIDIPEEAVKVTWMGVSQEFKQRQINTKEIKQFPFILYVGQRNGYKNFERFIRAFGSDLNLRKQFTVIAVGGGRFSKNEKLLFEELGITGRVLQRSVTDEELSMLYSTAAIFVFPSLQEGFGIPLIEALSCGTPTACSDIPVFREISMGAAKYFDPYSIDSIKETINVVANFTEEMKISNRIRFSAEYFSWESCAAQTEEIYLDLLN